MLAAALGPALAPLARLLSDEEDAGQEHDGSE
jgi:hypothetical protein